LERASEIPAVVQGDADFLSGRQLLDAVPVGCGLRNKRRRERQNQYPRNRGRFTQGVRVKTPECSVLVTLPNRGAPALIYFGGMANPKYKVSDKAIPVTELVDTLSDGTKVKRRIPRMRACNEKDAKGKLCAGHLKRWYFFGDEVKRKFGPEAEIYRCEHCKTLYLPSLEEEPRTGTLAW